MTDSFSAIITLGSYVAGTLIAFKVFDLRKKGKERDVKDDRLLWPLVLLFGLGGGSLIAYMLKSWMGLQ